MNDIPSQFTVDTDALELLAHRLRGLASQLGELAGSADRAAAEPTVQHFPAVENGPETGQEWDVFRQKVAEAVTALRDGAEFFADNLGRTAASYQQADAVAGEGVARTGDRPGLV